LHDLDRAVDGARACRFGHALRDDRDAATSCDTLSSRTRLRHLRSAGAGALRNSRDVAQLAQPRLARFARRCAVRALANKLHNDGGEAASPAPRQSLHILDWIES
jgi:hypothetical protein